MAAGVALVVVGSLLGLVTTLALWRRAPGVLTVPLMAGCGVLVGAGALLVQDGVTGVEWAITLIVLGAMTPVHARLVFGRPGTPR